MALPSIVKDLKALPDAFHEHYSPLDKDDPSAGFVLDTDKSQEKGSIREYRNTYKEVAGRAEAAEAKLKAFGDQDPETLKRAMSALKQVEDSEEQKLILDGKIDEVLTKRTESMRSTFTGQIEAQTNAYKELEQSHAGLKAQLSQIKVGDMVAQGIEKAGMRVRSGAMPHILRQTQDTFGLDDKGNPYVKQGPKYGKSGDPLTIPEYIEGLAGQNPFFFEGSSSGGGSEGSSATGERTVVIEGNDPTSFSKVGIEAIASGKQNIQVNG